MARRLAAIRAVISNSVRALDGTVDAKPDGMPNQMEKIASKGMGKAKAAKAKLTGLKGVFAKLAEQHGEVSALLKRGKTASDPEKRRDLWTKVRKELLSHERAETSEIYSVLRELRGTKTIARHHDKEADELEALIARVDDADPSTKAWATAFKKLADTVEHHAKEEENEIFPKAQEVLGDERAEQLERPFMAAKERVMKGFA